MPEITGTHGTDDVDSSEAASSAAGWSPRSGSSSLDRLALGEGASVSWANSAPV